jgi:hypothetical protein
MSEIEQPKEKKIDYLDEDPPILGQEWICASFLSPENVKGCKMLGFKFRGAFHTQKEAEAHAKYIQDKIDPDFHIYVGEGFKWLPWNQDPETVEDQEYYEKELNTLMKSVKDELLLKKQREHERVMNQKAEVESKACNPKETGKTRERLQKKMYQKKKSEQDSKNIVENSAEIIAKKDDTEKQLDTKKKEISEINDGLHELQKVYTKLLDKTNKDKLKNNV